MVLTPMVNPRATSYTGNASHTRLSRCQGTPAPGLQAGKGVRHPCWWLQLARSVASPHKQTCPTEANEPSEKDVGF